MSQTVGFVIAPNLETCLEIAAYDMPVTLPRIFTGNQRLTHFSKAPIEAGIEKSKLQTCSTDEWEDSLILQLGQSLETDRGSTGVPIHEGLEDDADLDVSARTRQRNQWSHGLARKFSNAQGLIAEMVTGIRRGHSLDTQLNRQGDDAMHA